MSWARFFELCAAAGGPVRVAPTARAAGLDVRGVRDRVRREGWWHPYPGVAAPPGTPVDARTVALAAIAHLRGRTGRPEQELVAATRWTGAHLLGIRASAPSRPQLVVPHERRVWPRSDLEVHRMRDLRPADVTLADGVPTLRPARLLRDLAAACRTEALTAAAIDLLQRGAVSLADLRAEVERSSAFPGRSRLRQTLAELAGAGRTDSPLELEARHRLGAAGVPLDRGQVAVPLVRTGRLLHLDLGIAAICFAIEVDSFGFHSRRDDVTRDAHRANAIAEVEHDWRVLHLTWDILHTAWDEFLVRVREVVAAQSRRHLGVPWPRPGDVAG